KHKKRTTKFVAERASMIRCSTRRRSPVAAEGVGIVRERPTRQQNRDLTRDQINEKQNPMPLWREDYTSKNPNAGQNRQWKDNDQNVRRDRHPSFKTVKGLMRQTARVVTIVREHGLDKCSTASTREKITKNQRPNCNAGRGDD